MTTVMTLRDIPDLATLRAAVEAIARETDVQWTFIDGPDHMNPFGDWVTIGFRKSFTADAWVGDPTPDVWVGDPGFGQ